MGERGDQNDGVSHANFREFWGAQKNHFLYCMNKRFEFWYDGYFKEFENTQLGFLVQRFDMQ
jgi:hypothetical protein